MWNTFEATKAQDKFSLSSAGNRMYHTPNAGGNSLWSEVVSLEILEAEFGAKLLRTEMEIEYNCECKITDYSIGILSR